MYRRPLNDYEKGVLALLSVVAACLLVSIIGTIAVVIFA